MANNIPRKNARVGLFVGGIKVNGRKIRPTQRLSPRHHQEYLTPGADTSTMRGHPTTSASISWVVCRSSIRLRCKHRKRDTSDDKHGTTKIIATGGGREHTSHCSETTTTVLQQHLVAPFGPQAVREPPRGVPFPGGSCPRRPTQWRATGLHRFQRLRSQQKAAARKALGAIETRERSGACGGWGRASTSRSHSSLKTEGSSGLYA